MNQTSPYKRRIERVFKKKLSNNVDINRIIEKYQHCLDAYLVTLYSSYFINANYNNQSKFDYYSIFNLLSIKYNIKFDITESLKFEQFDELNRLIVETIDLFEFDEKGLNNLTNELKWLLFDKIANDKPELKAKKEVLFNKYAGYEDELFDLLKSKYSSKIEDIKDLTEVSIDNGSLNNKFESFFENKIEPSTIISNNESNTEIINFTNQEELSSQLSEQKIQSDETVTVNTNPSEVLNENNSLDDKLIPVIDSKNEENFENRIEVSKKVFEQNSIHQATLNESEEPRLESTSSEVNTEIIKDNSSEDIDFYDWKGLKIPNIKATNLKEAQEKASIVSNFMPIYNKEKVYKWNSKILTYKEVNNPTVKTKKEKKKIVVKKGVLIPSIMSAAAIILFLVFYFLEIPLPFIKASNEEAVVMTDQPTKIEKSEKKSGNKANESNKVKNITREKQENNNSNSVVNSPKNEIDESQKIIESKNKIDKTVPKQPKETKIEEVIAIEKPKVAKVKSQVPISNTSNFYLIAGSFSNEENANKFFNQLTEKGFSPVNLGNINNSYKIAYSAHANQESADEELKKLRAEGIKTWVFKR